MLALAIYAAVVTECSQHTSALKPVGGILLRPWPVATTATLIVIGSVSTLQLAWLPSLQTHLERDRAVVGLVVRRSAASLPAVLWLIPVVVLVLARDMHGAASVAGLVVGLGIRYRQGRQRM